MASAWSQLQADILIGFDGDVPDGLGITSCDRQDVKVADHTGDDENGFLIGKPGADTDALSGTEGVVIVADGALLLRTGKAFRMELVGLRPLVFAAVQQPGNAPVRGG